MANCFSSMVISSTVILVGPSTQFRLQVVTFHAKDSAISIYAIDVHAARKIMFSRSNMVIQIR